MIIMIIILNSIETSERIQKPYQLKDDFGAIYIQEYRLSSDNGAKRLWFVWRATTDTARDINKVSLNHRMACVKIDR